MGRGGALVTEAAFLKMERCPRFLGRRVVLGNGLPMHLKAASNGLQSLDLDPPRHAGLRGVVCPGLVPDLLLRPTLRDVADHAARIGKPPGYDLPRPEPRPRR